MNVVTQRVNIWDYIGRAEVICVTTNGILKKDGTLVMGAGIAKQAADMFPELPKLWGEWVQAAGNIPCVSFKDGGTIIASFPTKHSWKDPSCLKLIANSARCMVHYADETGKTKFLLPPPGCGHGQLNWDSQVEPVLRGIFDERFWVLRGR